VVDDINKTGGGLNDMSRTEDGKSEQHLEPTPDSASRSQKYYTGFVEKGPEDNTSYSAETTLEKATVPDHGPPDGKDPEDTSDSHVPWHRRLLEHQRLIHAVIWLLFTG
jgi:hypothetical protein